MVAQFNFIFNGKYELSTSDIYHNTIIQYFTVNQNTVLATDLIIKMFYLNFFYSKTKNISTKHNTQKILRAIPLLPRHPSSYPLSEDMPALMISSTNNKLLAITVLKKQKGTFLK